MKENNFNQIYETPEVGVHEMTETEVVCQSGTGNLQQYNDLEWSW